MERNEFCYRKAMQKQFPDKIIIIIHHGHCELQGIDAVVVATLLDLPLIYANGLFLAGFKQKMFEEFTNKLVITHKLSLAILDISNHFTEKSY